MKKQKLPIIFFLNPKTKSQDEVCFITSIFISLVIQTLAQ